MNELKTITDSPQSLEQQVEQLGHFIGNTPLYPIKQLNDKQNVQVFAKLEWQQFSGSVKARPAYRIIKDAIKEGKLGAGRHLLDASSGNTGIAYAHIGASLGIPVTLFLPESVSQERKRRLKALGVDLHLTSASGGIDESQELVKELAQKDPGKYFYANQYDNDSNWSAHYDTTGPEIWRQTEGKITHFITGLGTSGTFMGTSRRLKEFNPDIRVISVQPDSEIHARDLEGWKHMATARVPAIYDDTLADENRTITTDQAHEMLKKAAKKEGLLLSPSASADLTAALQLAEELDEGIIVTVFPDNGNKYGEDIDKILGTT
jgi:cysteine synthase B